MKKMSETSMKKANGGYTYYCVCGRKFKFALTYNVHCSGCVYFKRMKKGLAW